MEKNSMNSILNINDREKYLIDLIFEHYKNDKKQDIFYNKLISTIKKIIAKDEIKPSRGYLEDADSVKIYERIKASEIAVDPSQCLIVAREGKVKANIEGSVIYISGKVEGDIESKYLYVRGMVDGNVNSDYVEVFPKGTVKGEVETSRLIIHQKAEIEGNCQIK
jgi:cytoskeletal protein CcmA (bactofilin family)